MPRSRFPLMLALLASLGTGAALAQPVNPNAPPPAAGTRGDEKQPEGGSETVARLLEALKPGVDTEIPPTPSQITDKIERLLNEGRNEDALRAIAERQAEEETRHVPGTDVQLQFQHARALAAVGRADEARAIYLEMTTRYPELPEPWNNLAALYVQSGDLDQAQKALEMALLANPGYATARANLGEIQLLLAQRAFQTAASQGIPGAAAKAKALQPVIQGPDQK